MAGYEHRDATVLRPEMNASTTTGSRGASTFEPLPPKATKHTCEW